MAFPYGFSQHGSWVLRGDISRRSLMENSVLTETIEGCMAFIVLTLEVAAFFWLQQRY